jgi:2-amino-4-hydroxy-6-hydroxymethyldihydropteridine diphosphokinase
MAALPAQVISDSRILCFSVNRRFAATCAGGTAGLETTLTVVIVASAELIGFKAPHGYQIFFWQVYAGNTTLLLVHKIVFLSLGSNLGDRMANITTALDRLKEIGEIESVSSIYETEPVEFAAQPWFLNCVAKLKTEKMPKQLLTAILKIEQGMGRQRQQKKGPRIIDIDILLFGSSVVDSAGLTVPHPSMHERRFVLVPLAEIAPEVRHPIFKRRVRELLEDLPAGQGVRRLKGSTDAGINLR